MSTADLNERLLKASHLFGRFDGAAVRALAGHAHRARVERGEALWRAGEAALHFTLILSGLVKIVRVNPDASEAIVGIFGPRESIGDTAAIQRGRYPNDAVAASDSVEVLRVAAAPVLGAMATDPAIGEAIARSLLEHTRVLQQKIEIMSAGSVPKRLATLFLYLAERFGDDADDGTTIIPVALNRTELSRLVSATVETTIRTLSRWQKSGWLRTTGEGFVLERLEPLQVLVRGADG